MRVDALRCLLAGILVPVFLSACSLKVKVSEEWSLGNASAISLEGASQVWSKLQAGKPLSQESLEIYNETILHSVVQIAKNWTKNDQQEISLRTTEGSAVLHVNSADTPNEVVPADFVRVRRGLSTESKIPGLGVPLIVRKARTLTDPYIPETGLWVPMTALMNFNEPAKPVLDLIDSTREDSITFAGTKYPLAANYTAAFARDFQDRGGQFADFSGLLHFDRFAKRMGPYRVTPFDPNKEICIFVHGIYSSPSTWDEAINSLYGDAYIRSRYEFWTFGYPTGAPIQYLAAEFRKALRDVVEQRRVWGAKDQKIIVVGHSMGGLLAKAATLSSGDAEWERLFRVPIDELKLSENGKESLRRMIYFDPVPEIKQVIFCAVPHGGSEVARQPGVRVISDLIELPAQIISLSGQILASSANALTPLGEEFAKGKTSVDQLRSGAWTTAVFLNKPLNPDVTYYSIIGNNRPAGIPMEKTGDGVVPYRSSHIEGVASELLVRPSGHAVHQTSKGIEEIRRILTLPQEKARQEQP